MQVGDLVKIVKVNKPSIGVLIERRILHSGYRFDILCEGGKIVKGLPETYIELISEAG